MAEFFKIILYQPFFNALVFLYQYLSFHDLGVAVILLTVIIRLILYPLFHKSSRDQAILQRLSPRIKEIQTTHKHDKEKQTRALMDLYKEHKVNPFSGFLLILIQLPILIALYQVFRSTGSMDSLSLLYSFMSQPHSFNHYFLGLIDLSQKNLGIALLAAIGQFFQGKLSMAQFAAAKNKNQEADMAQTMNRQMVFLGPVLTFAFLWFFNLPSVIGLYWLTTSAFSVIQQIVINKKVAEHFEIKEAIKNSKA